jgi:hypothetical protein
MSHHVGMVVKVQALPDAVHQVDDENCQFVEMILHLDVVDY